jgi:hypothetical protein
MSRHTPPLCERGRIRLAVSLWFAVTQRHVADYPPPWRRRLFGHRNLPSGGLRSAILAHSPAASDATSLGRERSENVDCTKPLARQASVRSVGD